MSGRGTFTTSVEIGPEDEPISVDIRVTYARFDGYKGSLIDPPEPASVEIVDITAADPSVTIPDALYEDEALIAECEQDWQSDMEELAEWRAQNRRDAMLMGDDL